MILLDTNVILDLFDSKSAFNKWAGEVIVNAVTGQGAVVNPVALAECLHRVSDSKKAIQELTSLGIQLIDLPHQAAETAAAAFRAYLVNRKASGAPDPHSKMPLPDFFIGAHAQNANYQVATRDPARFETYFPALQLIQPKTPSP